MLTYPYYTNSAKKIHSAVLGPKTEATVPKRNIMTHKTLRCTCAARVGSKKIHSTAHPLSEQSAYVSCSM